MKNKQYIIAREFNIFDRIQKLENEFLQVKGVVEVEFDLYGFYDNMNQVIFLTKYEINDNQDYFKTRKELINNVLTVANNNGLTITEDTIEDYGTSFYFVTRCNKEWIKE